MAGLVVEYYLLGVSFVGSSGVIDGAPRGGGEGACPSKAMRA